MVNKRIELRATYSQLVAQMLTSRSLSFLRHSILTAMMNTAAIIPKLCFWLFDLFSPLHCDGTGYTRPLDGTT